MTASDTSSRTSRRGDLVRAVDRLVDQVGHWSAARWSAAAHGGGSRADAVHALAQRLADLEAAVAGHPPHRVPRLDNDLVLPDQVRVTALDLLAADPPMPVVADALAAVAETRALIQH